MIIAGRVSDHTSQVPGLRNTILCHNLEILTTLSCRPKDGVHNLLFEHLQNLIGCRESEVLQVFVRILLQSVLEGGSFCRSVSFPQDSEDSTGL